MTNAMHSRPRPYGPAGQRHTFGGVGEEPRYRGDESRTRYERIQQSREFSALRSRHRRFVFPVAAAFVVWYMLYVILAAYASDFMSHRLFGAVNVGLVLGIVQFLTTAVVTTLYVRFAHRELDPQVDRIRSNAGEDDQ